VFSLKGRKLLRPWPDARDAFIVSGSWVAFSKRFGLPYIVALLAFPFVWMAIFIKTAPDTIAGAWFLFGPGIVTMVLGCTLGALRVARWMIDRD
jgi:hypothetical protein